MPKENLGPAVAANSVGVNISRAVGPAVGGVAPPHELSRYWDETDIAFVSHHAAGFMGTRPSPVDMACHELSFEQSASYAASREYSCALRFLPKFTLGTQGWR